MRTTQDTSARAVQNGTRPSRLDHRIEEYEDRTECTVFPRDADEDAVVTQWITATDDAFVDLEDAR